MLSVRPIAAMLCHYGYLNIATHIIIYKTKFMLPAHALPCLGTEMISGIYIHSHIYIYIYICVCAFACAPPY
jgi:hypothetical protein